ncbi:unnamed protein product [Amoebophrya sp. A25]|nr:unnamed protein product [Amoebophrya sp. A25]|eukprot:GSA25T00025378001.1
MAKLSFELEAGNLLHRQKVLIAAAYAGAECKKVATEGGPIPAVRVGTSPRVEYLGPCLRRVAGLKQELLGADSFQSAAAVDSWLEWTETEVGVKMGKALTEVLKHVLEPHLTKKTFLVTEQITIADISLALSLYPKMTSAPPADCPAITRWFNTCLHQPQFQKVLGETASSGAAAAAASSAASSGGVPAKSETTSISALMLKPEDRPLQSEYSQCSNIIGGRTRIGRIQLSADAGESLIGQKFVICGWVKTMREQAELTFLSVNDGSCFADLQVVIEKGCRGAETLKGAVNTGASVKCCGTLVASPADGQKVELVLKQEDEVTVLGSVSAAGYPLIRTKKAHSREHLRTNAHLRPRSNLIGAVARVRSSLAYATHEFFRRRQFLYVHTPLITASDCEGAGEMFQVTTLLDQMQKDPSDKDYIPFPKSAKDLDFSKDFFKAKSYLTVSGQLAVENYCCSLSDVYTFGPTFRAENSHTTRHLSEFWMIEPELAFADLHDVMQCAEDYLKFCVQYAVDNCYTDLEFFDKQVEKGLLARLKNLLEKPFGRMSYTEAIELLDKEVKNGNFKKYLETNYATEHDKKAWPQLLTIEWGMDLNSAHEKYIAEEYFKRPVAVYNYPAAIKSFYMRANDDGRTCAAMDVLAPLVGEVIGGSQREERHDVLTGKIKENGLNEADYWWYLDLRKYGTVPHGGFGLGFERLIMLTTGIDNIRDVIPFPRYPGHAEF